MLGSAYQGTHSEEEGFVQLTDLLVLTSSDQQLLILKTLFTFLQKLAILMPLHNITSKLMSLLFSVTIYWLEENVLAFCITNII